VLRVRFCSGRRAAKKLGPIRVWARPSIGN
jgi:hypothetical protein